MIGKGVGEVPVGHHAQPGQHVRAARRFRPRSAAARAQRLRGHLFAAAQILREIAGPLDTGARAYRHGLAFSGNVLTPQTIRKRL